MRVLAVLAVLLGLLAMHGLASTHHAAAASSTPHAAQSVTAPAGGPGAGAHEHASATSAAMHGTAALTGGPGASCDEDCPDLAVLCVAVLTGAVLALLLARRRLSPLLPPTARQTFTTPEPAVRHARGPDPVRELCVSRT